MIKRLCKNCGIPIEGTARKEFCSTECRSAKWQEAKREQQGRIKRMKSNKQSENLSTEKAQYQVLAGLITLRDAAKKGDKFAIKVLNEVNRQLDNIETILRVERLKHHEEN